MLVDTNVVVANSSGVVFCPEILSWQRVFRRFWRRAWPLFSRFSGGFPTRSCWSAVWMFLLEPTDCLPHRGMVKSDQAEKPVFPSFAYVSPWSINGSCSVSIPNVRWVKRRCTTHANMITFFLMLYFMLLSFLRPHWVSSVVVWSYHQLS